MTDENIVQLAINTIRTLSIDAVQQAKSGLVIGFLHDEFIEVPSELAVRRGKAIDPAGNGSWSGALATAGQPERL